MCSRFPLALAALGVAAALLAAGCSNTDDASTVGDSEAARTLFRRLQDELPFDPRAGL